MNKAKAWLCKEEPGILALYAIVAGLIIAEFCLLGWHFFLVILGGLALCTILFGIGYVLMLVIKKLQENCNVQETE